MFKKGLDKLCRVAGIAADILTAALLILCVFIALSCLSVQNPSSPIGLSLGAVQSGSMEKSGIYAGDFMLITRKKDYVAGDVIAFYRAPALYGGRAEDADLKNRAVWMHEIIDVKVDDTGRQTYLTKGTSNNNDDGAYVPRDFVLGKAVKLPAAISGFLGFACTREGIVWLVIMPCGLILVYLSYVLVTLITAPKESENSPHDAAAAAEAYIEGAGGEMLLRKKTFYAKMCLAEERIKEMYSALANALFAYRGVRRRRSKKCDTFRAGGKIICIMRVRGKTLCADFAGEGARAAQYVGAADTSDTAGTAMSSGTANSDTQSFNTGALSGDFTADTGENPNTAASAAEKEEFSRIRVTGSRSLKAALERAEKRAAELGLIKKARYKERNFAAEFPATSEAELAAAGHITEKRAAFARPPLSAGQNRAPLLEELLPGDPSQGAPPQGAAICGDPAQNDPAAGARARAAEPFGE